MPTSSSLGTRALRGLGLIVLCATFGIFGTILLRQGGAIGGAIFGGSLILLQLGIRRGKRMRAKPAVAVLEEDSRAPVLYLRPFEADNQLVRANPGLPFLTKSYEQDLTHALRKLGPVVAVGNPLEDPSLPELGAARIYFRDGDWQRQVSELMLRAQLVVLHIGSSPGVQWEVAKAIELDLPAKLILCIPNSPDRDRLYDEFRRCTSWAFPKGLPSTANGQILCFESDWTPHVLQASQPVPSTTTSLQRLMLKSFPKARR